MIASKHDLERQLTDSRMRIEDLERKVKNYQKTLTEITSWFQPFDSNTPPDGVVDEFIFERRPQFISFNGLNQFEGAGYDIDKKGGLFYVKFKDVDGNVIVPDSTAHIKGMGGL